MINNLDDMLKPPRPRDFDKGKKTGRPVGRNGRKTTIAISVTETTAKRLRKRAEAEKRSVSSLAEIYLEAGLDRGEKEGTP